MTDSNSEYFARRSEQERVAAGAASDPQIAAVHEEMAALYATAARSTESSLQSRIQPAEDSAAA